MSIFVTISRVNRRLIATVLSLLLACHSALALPPDKRIKVPNGAVASLDFDKPVYFLGENVLVHFVLENHGTRPFTVESGGDYRMASRETRFEVTAQDSNGNLMPDPNPDEACLGGLVGMDEIKPEQKWYASLPLMRYREFDSPGEYTLCVTHDLGWDAHSKRPIPYAEGTIRLAMPSPEQARAVVDEMYSLPNDYVSSQGEKSFPHADFNCLCYPVYLPFLLPRAQAKDEKAIEAIRWIPSSEATAGLIELLKINDREFVKKVAQALSLRMPDPELTDVLPSRYFLGVDFKEVRQRLVRLAWSEKFAEAVRPYADRFLQDDDPEFVTIGAIMLECVGTAADISSFRAAYDRAITATVNAPMEKDVYPRPRGLCAELDRVAAMLGLRKVQPTVEPKTPGEIGMYLAAAKNSADFRPQNWKEKYREWLHHPVPYVRELTLKNMPEPIPSDLRGDIAGAFDTSDPDVLIAACQLVEKNKLSECRTVVIAALRSADERWLISFASDAAAALGANLEKVEALIPRLDEKNIELAQVSLYELVRTVINRRCSYDGDPFAKADKTKLKKRWLEFIQRHRDVIQANKKFKPKDRAVSADLFPGISFYGDSTE
jgi:hypothetical protein